MPSKTNEEPAAAPPWVIRLRLAGQTQSPRATGAVMMAAELLTVTDRPKGSTHDRPNGSTKMMLDRPLKMRSWVA